MIGFFYTLDIIIFLMLALPSLYLLVFALAALPDEKKIIKKYPASKEIALLIPAYKEDAVILQTVQEALKSRYPKELYDIVVISDSMTAETNRQLEALPIKLIIMPSGENTKGKALNKAIDEIGEYDIIAILDADNVCSPNFLAALNNAFCSGCLAIQAHRTSKNINNSFSMLDAISEEINNSIFRKGHYFLGLSASLIGSAMAFDYNWFKNNIKKIKTVGEDKEIEYLLLNDKIKIHYLNNEIILDEKVSQYKSFYQQRRRWLATQLEAIKSCTPEFLNALKQRNKNLANKIIQQFILPRVLLLGILCFISCLVLFFPLAIALKWWILTGLYIITLLISVPKRFYNKKLGAAILHIPSAFFLMFFNLFRLKGAGKKFIHTEHGK